VRAPLLLATSLLVLAPAGAARAYDIEIESETIGQGYQLVGGDGTIISRRRLDQYLGLSLWNIGPKDANGVPMPKNQFYFTSSMRLEFDFGDYPPTAGALGTRDVSSELSGRRFELLYAYFGARDLGGLVDLKLGRLVDYDLFEFVSWDGLSVEVKTPYYLAASAYTGLLVNGFLPIDSPIYRPDGTAPGGLDLHATDPKAVLGVGLRAFGFRDLDAHFSYRRVFSPTGEGAATAPCTNPQVDLLTAERCTGATDGTTEEKIGWSGRGRLLGGALVPWFGFRYDLLNSVLDTIQAGARFAISPAHAVQAEYFYSYPTFDGDSIWNLFVRSRFDDVRLSYDLRRNNVRAWARGFVRFFHDVGETSSPLTPALRPAAWSRTLDGGGDLGARLDLRRGYVRADAYVELGYGGRHIGADVSSRLAVWRDLASVEGRLTFAHFEDDLRPADSADSFGFQVGGRVALGRGILVHLILEDNINRFYNSQLRLYAVVDASVLLGSRGFAQGMPRAAGPGIGNFGSGYGMGMGY
jgi:hypothetical protein